MACRREPRRNPSAGDFTSEISTMATFDPLQLTPSNTGTRGAGRPSASRPVKASESFETSLVQSALPRIQARPGTLAPQDRTGNIDNDEPLRTRDKVKVDPRAATSGSNPADTAQRAIDDRSAPPPRATSDNTAERSEDAKSQTAKPSGDQDVAATTDSADATAEAVPSDAPTPEIDAANAGAALGADQTALLDTAVPGDIAPAPDAPVAADSTVTSQAAAAAATALATQATATPDQPVQSGGGGTAGAVDQNTAKATAAPSATVLLSGITKPEDVAVIIPETDADAAKPASEKKPAASSDKILGNLPTPQLLPSLGLPNGEAGRSPAAVAPGNQAATPVEPKPDAQIAAPALALSDTQTSSGATQPTTTPIVQGAASTLQPNATPSLAPAETTQIIRDNVPLDRLGVEIATTARAGVKEIAVRLDPPELGRIDVRIDIDDSGQVNTHLVVEHASTLDQLRRDAPNLERLLNQSGLKADSGSLQFSLQDQHQPYRQQGGDGRRTRRGILAIDGISGTADSAAAVQAAYVAPSRQGIDVRL